MTENTEKNNPIVHTADALDKWAASSERKLPKEFGHISFYGTLLKAIDNLPALVLTWLRSCMPEQVDPIQKDLDDLFEKSKFVDHERSESGGEADIAKWQAQAAAKNLAKKLRLLESIVESHSEQFGNGEKPAETERNTTPAINIQDSNVILGDVRQAENQQVGYNANINKHEKTKDKKGGIVWNLLKWFIGIIAAAVMTDILGDFGWIQSIKAFFYSILWPK